MRWTFVLLSMLCITGLCLSMIQSLFRSPLKMAYYVETVENRGEDTFTSGSHNKQVVQTIAKNTIPTAKTEVVDPMAIFLSQQKPPLFDPAFKNPCWWVGGHEDLACLPYFYMAGFPKSGTTDLYYRLIEHPHILGGRVKEPHFLTRAHFQPSLTPCKHGRQQDVGTSCEIYRYASVFFKSTAGKIKAPVTVDVTSFMPGELSKVKVKHPLITVDGSASTAWDNSRGYHIIRDMGGLSTEVSRSNASIIDWIVRMNPAVRFLLIVREPISRLYSDYNFFHRHTSAAAFDDLANTFVSNFSNCQQAGRSDLACARMWHKNHSLVRGDIGVYYAHIQDLLLRVPRERLLVIRSEDFHHNKSRSLQQVFNFLDLPLLTPKAMSLIVNKKDRNVNRKQVEPMWSVTRRKLKDFYRPFNTKLAKLLHNDIFLWDDVYAKDGY